jgi:hypothetical protein
MDAYIDYSEKKTFWKRCFEILKKHGIRSWLNYIYDFSYHIVASPGKFVFKNKEYKCIWKWRNRTWTNEREVELALSKELLKRYSPGQILEVGNVLNHYLKINHEVLDKYEKWEGVINKDIVDFSPNRKYDLILSISTLEHIGLDEVPSNPEKTLPAIKKMESLLSKNGKLFFTIPWYHNEYLKKIIMEDKIKCKDDILFVGEI